MAKDEHPDPTGPETPEEPTAARDGDPVDNVTPLRGGGESIGERAENGDEPQEPQPPPLEGTEQLTLAGLARRGMPIESVISIMSKEHPIKGMYKPDEEVVLIVTVRVNKYEYVPVRENGEVTRYKNRQQLRIVAVAEANTEAGKVAMQGR